VGLTLHARMCGSCIGSKPM